MTTTVTVRAHAKLTLTLRVLGTRPDGFHELEALTVSLDTPADELTVTRVGGRGVHLGVEGAPADVPVGDANLAARAVAHLVEGGHVPDGWALALRKGIPVGGGLGGGSADAAAALAAVATLAGGPAPAVLAAVAAALGSDVPFCLDGGGAWMRGRGERLEPVTVPPVWCVVATPGLGVSTPAVYRAWDELGGPAGDRAVAPPPALGSLVPALVNDLEPAAVAVEPRLAAFRDDLARATGAEPVLAGSGAAYAVVLDDPDRARGAADAAASAGIAATVGASVAAGWAVVARR